MKLEEFVPRLLTQSEVDVYGMVQKMKNWDRDETRYQFDMLPSRYKVWTDQEMGSYTGMKIFTRLVEFLEPYYFDCREIEYIRIMAQEEVIKYYNMQFNDRNQNTKLPAKDQDSRGSKEEVLRDGRSAPRKTSNS